MAKAEAQRVTIGIGQTMSDLVMTLMPAQRRASPGRRSSEGRPATGMVMVVPLSAGMDFGSPGR